MTEKNKKEEFYQQLSETITTVKKRDVIIVMGVMNAKLGPNNEGLEHVMRRHGIGNMNENGELFSELYANCDLIIGGTVFPHKTCHKVSWVSPDNITENQTDHIEISKRFRRSLLGVRNKRGVDICSDHHLMIANFRLKILAARKKFETRRKKYNVQKFLKPSIREEFKLELKNRFSVLSTQNEDTNIEASWKAIKNVYIETSEKILGFREKEWISEETWKKIETRKLAKENVNRSKTRQQKTSAQTQYLEINKRVKRSISKDKRNWVNEQAKQAEEAERKGDRKELYNITRKLSQRKFRMNRPVKNKSGMLLTTQEEQLKRWEEHFSEIFNKDDNKTGSEQEMRNVKENNNKNENETEVNLDPSTKTEIKLALTQLKNRKAVGLDYVNPEVLEVDLEITVEMLYPLLEKIWKEEKIPEEWEKGLTIKIP